MPKPRCNDEEEDLVSMRGTIDSGGIVFNEREVFQEISKALYYPFKDCRAFQSFVRAKNADYVKAGMAALTGGQFKPKDGVMAPWEFAALKTTDLNHAGWDPFHLLATCVKYLLLNLKSDRKYHPDYYKKLSCHPTLYGKNKKPFWSLTDGLQHEIDAWIEAIQIPTGACSDFEVNLPFKRTGLKLLHYHHQTSLLHSALII